MSSLSKGLRGPIDIAEFLAREPSPRSPLLGCPGSEWLHEQDLVMVYAKRGVGKTFFSMGIAVAIAAGGPFLDWQAPQCRSVLYVDGEMADRDLWEWFTTTLKCSGVNPDHIPLMLWSAAHEELPNLETLEGQRNFMELANLDRGDVVIFDNESCLFREPPGGVRDENSGRSVEGLNTFLIGLRRMGLTVILVHHAGKSGEQRGSSRREDALNTSICLRHPKDYRPTDGARFIIEFQKARNLRGASVQSIEAHLIESADGRPAWQVQPSFNTKTEHILHLWLENFGTQQEIANEVGCSAGQVSKVMREARMEGRISD